MSALPDRLRTLGTLRGPREAVLFARICVFAAMAPLLMRLPLPRLAALLARAPRRRSPPVPADRLAVLVGIAPRVAHPLVRSGCLTRGLTLFWFLRRDGVDVDLRFGLDPEDAARGVDGHCWLTLDGEPYLEKVDPRPRFAEIYRIPLAVA